MKKYLSILCCVFIFISCSSPDKQDKLDTPVKKAEQIKKKNESVEKEISAPNNVHEEESTPKEKKEKSQPVEIKFPEAIGIWMVPVEKILPEDGKPVILMVPSIFKYDGIYLTRNILIINGGTPSTPNKWLSKDGYYKLKTEWHEDSLFYHSPFGTTDFMAKLIDGKFQLSDVFQNVNHSWVFEMISEKEVPEYLKPILKKRKVFDYSLINQKTSK